MSAPNKPPASSQEKVKTSLKGKAPSIMTARNLFKFPNGDIYTGFYRATIKEEIFREGKGKYFCRDGTIYSGKWHEDDLIRAASVTYSNDVSYEGGMQKFQYHGRGIYYIPGVGAINGKFDENRLQGPVSLTDPHGVKWFGFAKDNVAEFYPSNQFKLHHHELQKKQLSDQSKAESTLGEEDANL